MFWGCTYCNSGEGASFWGENCIEVELSDGGWYETDRGGLERVVSSRVHHCPQTKDGPEILCLIWLVSNPGHSTQNLNIYSLPRAITPWNIIKSMFCRMRRKTNWCEVALHLLLWCYILICGYLQTFQDRLHCTATSLTTYQSKLCNIPEEQRHLYNGGSLKSCISYGWVY